MLLRTFLLLFLALQASGQERIAIKVANDVPIVPVRVNGRDLLFVLDTGSERSAIDAPLVAALNLKTVGDVKVLRNYRVFETTGVEARTIEVGNHTFAQTILTVADMKPASRALDVDVDGILGNDVLEEMIFTLNYSKAELVVSHTALTGSGIGVSLELSTTSDQFFARVDLLSQAAELLVDTGTNSTISPGALGKNYRANGSQGR